MKQRAIKKNSGQQIELAAVKNGGEKEKSLASPRDTQEFLVFILESSQFSDFSQTSFAVLFARWTRFLIFYGTISFKT